MSNVKIPSFGKTYTKEQRTKMVSTFLLLLLLLIFFMLLPKLNEQKIDIYKIEYSEKLFLKEGTPYQDLLNGKLDIDDISKKRSVIQSNSLQASDPNNYLYIESYISEQLNIIGLPPFTFSTIYNFKNSGKNSINLNIIVTEKEKIVTFLEAVGNNGFLGRNINIKKEGGIYNANIELVFEIK